MANNDKYLWWMQQTGLGVARKSGDEVYCICPYCGRGKEHFSFNISKMVFHCFGCDVSGTYFDLLEQLSLDLAEDLTAEELRCLAKDRKLPTTAFKGLDIGFTGKFYTLPVRDSKGHIHNVLRYRLGDKLRSAPGCRMGLFGAQHLADKAKEDEPVYLVEGPWDALALDWLRKAAHKSGVVVAVLGAGHLPDEYVPLLRGRTVSVFQDNDTAGARGEAAVASKLKNVVAGVKFYHWGEKIPDGMDVRDIITEATVWQG